MSLPLQELLILGMVGGRYGVILIMMAIMIYLLETKKDLILVVGTIDYSGIMTMAL